MNPTHWTISRWDDYAKCPKRYKARYIDKSLPFVPNAAADRGTRIHQIAEDFVLGKRDDLPEISPSWAIQIEELKRIGAKAEEMWEFSEGWHPVEPGYPVWFRMKMDVHYLNKTALHLIDYKTGKIYPSNIEQIEVYALAAFAKFDEVDTVHGALWYLDQHEPNEKTYKRSQAEKLARKWDQRAHEMLTAEKFPAKPNKFCSWCPLFDTCAEGQAAAGKFRRR